MRKINFRIKTSFDLCTGCDICRLECSARSQKGFNPRLALLRVETGEEGLVNFPVVCQQCENAFCIKVCPHGAMVSDEKMQIPVVIEDKCRKCGLCISYCPIGIIKNDAEGKAIKCDLCHGDPVCVKACPVGALKLVREVSDNE